MKYLTLDQLAPHPKNVRAKSDYSPEGLASLAASIAAQGLLQGFVVQQLEDGGYGVLAGRRRMLALQRLAAEGRLAAEVKIPCKVIEKSIDHVTAVSLAENILQEPMSALDEFEAFAAMAAEGTALEDIAASFATTLRAVKERLRYGRIHPDIRDAARAKAISLDVMKAYAGHPCAATQCRVFDGFLAGPGHAHQSWSVQRALAEQDLRADDALGAYVIDAYRARGGEIIEGLFAEDTVLKDRGLAEAIRDEQLLAAAEAVRMRHGLKWAETRPAWDYGALIGYGRIYPRPRELNEADEVRLTELTERMDAIVTRIEEIERAGYVTDVIEDKIETLTAEHAGIEAEVDDLQEAYDPEEAARAGVIAIFAANGNVRIETGLVRPEDAARVPEDEDGNGPDAPAPSIASAGLSGESSDVGAAGGDAFAETETKLSNALLDDLASERAELIAAALAEDPTLAYDALVFKAAWGVFSPYGYSPGLDVSVRAAARPHSRKEAQDPEVAARIEAARAALDLSFLDDGLSDGERFCAFREIDAAAKAAILAVAMAASVEPARAGRNPERKGFIDALAAEAVPDPRAVWRPTAANYWSRVSRAHMLGLLRRFGMDAEAEDQASAKKSTLADFMEKLFAAPFATLSPAQRAAVEAWAPTVIVPATHGLEAAIDGDASDDDGSREDADAQDLSAVA